MLLVVGIRNEGVNRQGEVAAGWAINTGSFIVYDFGDDGAEHGVFILGGRGLRVGFNDRLHARDEGLPGLVIAAQLVEQGAGLIGGGGERVAPGGQDGLPLFEQLGRVDTGFDQFKGAGALFLNGGDFGIELLQGRFQRGLIAGGLDGGFGRRLIVRKPVAQGEEERVLHFINAGGHHAAIMMTKHIARACLRACLHFVAAAAADEQAGKGVLQLLGLGNGRERARMQLGLRGVPHIL